MQKKKIRILTDETINQIAAGEVVEDPASVVKELFENSVDAGATKVTIEIKGGGHLMIRVSDDGSGMSKDDAILAFERHATSKIASVDDLMKLSTMGFRGEALASIAAVSKVELETSDGETATKVICHGGRMLKVEPCARKQGTTIEISSLFYNIPARKKFQKSAQASMTEIAKIAAKLALAHPSIELRLISQEKDTLVVGKVDRMEGVLGKDFLVGSRKVDFEENGYKIHGVIGSPEASRQNRTGQYLFINHRPIYSPLISSAVQTAFGTRIGSKMHPTFVLWFDLPGDAIDVNVHPQKREVRFGEEALVAKMFEKAVIGAFAPLPKITFDLPKFEPIPKTFREPKGVYIPEVKRESITVLFIIDQVAFIQDDERHYFLDLPKASMRIHYDQLLSRLKGEKESALQRLLFPETIEFAGVEAKIIEAHLDLLKRVGFEMRPFGKNCFAIEAISPLFSIEDGRVLLEKLLDELKVEVNYEKIARLALSFGHKKQYTKEEAFVMVKELMKTSDPHYSPLGQKIMVAFDKEKIWKG